MRCNMTAARRGRVSYLSLTRVHFLALAEILQHYAASHPELVVAVADFCANNNPRFNRARFYEACGVKF